MTGYRTHLRIAPALPDGRLCAVDVQLPKHPGGLPLITSTYLAGHISPHLLGDLDEYFRHLAGSPILTMDTDGIGQTPEWDCWYERVDPRLLTMRTFALGIGNTDGRDFYAFRVRRDMISKQLCEELNQHTIPEYTGALPYTEQSRIRPPSARFSP